MTERVRLHPADGDAGLVAGPGELEQRPDRGGAGPLLAERREVVEADQVRGRLDAELIAARANAIFNQLYVVNVNAAQPVALGRSLVVDPEGLVRVQAGEGEELLTDVLDLDAVERVRSFGIAGVSRMWEQLDSLDGAGPELPMYGGRIRRRPSARRS